MRFACILGIVAVMGCALPSSEEPVVETAEQPICGNPLGCDGWLNKCIAKGGKENTQPGGVRMCCIPDKNGSQVCVSDPDAIVVKAEDPPPPPSPWPAPTVIVRPPLTRSP